MDVMDKTIRAKRGTCRERQRYKLISGEAPSQLKIQDIQRKVNTLDENIEAFEQIQEHHSERSPSEEEEKKLDTWRLKLRWKEPPWLQQPWSQ